jgi:hypothetical protein
MAALGPATPSPAGCGLAATPKVLRQPTSIRGRCALVHAAVTGDPRAGMAQPCKKASVSASNGGAPGRSTSNTCRFFYKYTRIFLRSRVREATTIVAKGPGMPLQQLRHSWLHIEMLQAPAHAQAHRRHNKLNVLSLSRTCRPAIRVAVRVHEIHQSAPDSCNSSLNSPLHVTKRSSALLAVNSAHGMNSKVVRRLSHVPLLKVGGYGDGNAL